jgi:hypothetical protein
MAHLEKKGVTVTSCRCVMKAETTEAYVDVDDWPSMKNAIKAHGSKIAGRKITVRRCLDQGSLQGVVAKHYKDGQPIGGRGDQGPPPPRPQQQKKQPPKKAAQKRKAEERPPPSSEPGSKKPKPARLSAKKRRAMAIQKANASEGFM